MSTMNSVVRMGHPSKYVYSHSPSAVLQLISRVQNLVTFGDLVIFSLIKLSIATWMTAKYNASHNFPTSSARARVCYTLFILIWTTISGSVYLVGFLVAASSIFTSVASHFFLYVLAHHLLKFLSSFFSNQILIRNITYSLFLRWIIWLAAAASITQTLGGTLNCHAQTYFVYCSQLNALSRFAWFMRLVRCGPTLTSDILALVLIVVNQECF